MGRITKSGILGLFDKIVKRRYDSTICFLCGTELTSLNSSVEHVFPRWLQSRYDLWDKRLILLNGTNIPYRSLAIPCCTDCNNNYLSNLERIIQKHAEGGFKTFQHLDRDKLFYWLGKIFYGIIYKEMFLATERNDPNSEKITSKEFLDGFKAHALFLQGIRGRHQFEHFFPASIIVVELQSPQKKELQWDFADSSINMFIALRMGTIGIIAVLQDGGAIELDRNSLDPFFRVPLHPIQFKELMALIAYRSILFNRTPKYISIEDGQIVRTSQCLLQGLSSKPIFDEWNPMEYAKILSFYTKIPVEKLNPSPNQVMTWIKDNDGNIKVLDVNEIPPI